MTQTIYDVLYKSGFTNLVRHTGDVGIEIETESKKEYRIPPMKFWNNHRDGSLRDFGVEYILKAPVSRGQELKTVLSEWKENVSDKFSLIDDSYSTSVHVHLNFLNNKWVHLANFLVTYYLVENLLIKYSGPDRLSNLFCLPICDAEGEIEGINYILRKAQSMDYKNIHLSADQYKYSALNLCNLSKLGTLESRSMRGITDINEIERWVNILLSIKDFAEGDRTPVSIIQMYQEQGPEIVYPIFGEYVQFLNFENKGKLIESNLIYAAKIVEGCKIENDKWGFPKPKKIYKAHALEDLNQMSKDQYGVLYSELALMYKLQIDETYARRFNLGRDQVTFIDEDI